MAPRGRGPAIRPSPGERFHAGGDPQLSRGTADRQARARAPDAGADGEEPCPGCGDRLPPIDGATHPYVGASSACWTRFAELSATLPAGGTPLRRLVADAYMVQHPGVPERRATQSVGLHLVALHLVLVRGLPPEQLSSTLQRLLARPPAWRWLDPPVPNGPLTIASLGAAGGAPAPVPAAAIEAYVGGVWSAWARHHAQVAAWASGVAAPS